MLSRIFNLHVIDNLLTFGYSYVFLDIYMNITKIVRICRIIVMGNVSRAEQNCKNWFLLPICMTTVLSSGACMFDETANINQILTRCLNRFGDFHFLIRDADTVKINFRHDVCI